MTLGLAAVVGYSCCFSPMLIYLLLDYPAEFIVFKPSSLTMMMMMINYCITLQMDDLLYSFRQCHRKKEEGGR